MKKYHGNENGIVRIKDMKLLSYLDGVALDLNCPVQYVFEAWLEYVLQYPISHNYDNFESYLIAVWLDEGLG